VGENIDSFICNLNIIFNEKKILFAILKGLHNNNNFFSFPFGNCVYLIVENFPHIFCWGFLAYSQDLDF